ncbi:YGGT domain-containing protein [Cephalotus follicularis]|uniref:YGGT domain-containing protein n=1 Tax=Cephalotus follicularis TaxID=3775 RepID=A0A1Q3BSK1_CEPFO|nr:YGGT domain-containing protein [Cephalotus follicularis]
MASLTVSNGTILRVPVTLPLLSRNSHHRPSKPNTVSYSLLPQKQQQQLHLSLSHKTHLSLPPITTNTKTNRFISLTSSSPSPSTLSQQNPNNPSPSLATKIVTFSAFLAKLINNLLNPYQPAIRSLQSNLAHSAGPLFFAAVKGRPSGYLNTPLTVVAAGLAKWLDIYSGVLMVRVLLSWFPNIPWDRQPLSAIRDLCDPYLNLFRNIIPPIFDTLDVSPLLAFAVLGTLGSILNSSRGMY